MPQADTLGVPAVPNYPQHPVTLQTTGVGLSVLPTHLCLPRLDIGFSTFGASGRLRIVFHIAIVPHIIR